MVLGNYLIRYCDLFVKNNTESKLRQSQKEKEKETRLSKKLPRKGFCRTMWPSIHHRVQFSLKKTILAVWKLVQNRAVSKLNQSQTQKKRNTHFQEIAMEVFLSNVQPFTHQGVQKTTIALLKLLKNHTESKLTKN